jgi:murein DD-endopeptidase MepM/ murein hydrolase activator NlpD
MKLIDKVKEYWFLGYMLWKCAILKNTGKIKYYAVLFSSFILVILLLHTVHCFKEQTFEKQVKTLQLALDYEKNMARVERKMIDDKVNALHTFLKRIYPNYDYQGKVNSAFEDKEKTCDLPEALTEIYVQENFIKPHGLERYEKTLKDICWPVEEKSSFTTGKNAEYGSPRPYSYYGYKHEGIDLFTYYNNSVFAVYNSYIWKKYYEEGGGWTIEAKFEYKHEDGKNEWYFVRYRHLQEIYVNAGDYVKKGDVIANMGKSGSFATGIHCHFELWKWNGERYINISPVQNSTWNNTVIARLL